MKKSNFYKNFTKSTAASTESKHRPRNQESDRRTGVLLRNGPEIVCVSGQEQQVV